MVWRRDKWHQCHKYPPCKLQSLTACQILDQCKMLGWLKEGSAARSAHQDPVGCQLYSTYVVPREMYVRYSEDKGFIL